MSTRDLSWQKLNAIQRKERQFEEFKDATTGVAASLKHSSNVISYNDRQYTEDEGGSNVERERKQKKKLGLVNSGREGGRAGVGSV